MNVVKAFGFSDEKEFEVFMSSYFSTVKYLKEAYKLDKLSKLELDGLLIDAIDLTVITNSFCDSQRKSCRSSAINDYTQDILACGGAGALIATASGYTLTLLGAGVTFFCVGEAINNLDVQIRFCDAQYDKCVKK